MESLRQNKSLVHEAQRKSAELERIRTAQAMLQAAYLNALQYCKTVRK